MCTSSPAPVEWPGQYARRGFAFAGMVLDADALAALREACDRLMPLACASSFGLIVHQGWLRDRALAAAVSRLAPIACMAMQAPEVVFFQDHLLSKTPQAGGEMALHQDYSFWPLDSPDGLTLWVALDDADAGNGCLHYRDGEGREIVAETPAGAAWVHHPLVWHRSAPNGSMRPRRAWSLTWVSPAVRWAPERAPHPFTVLQRRQTGSLLGPEFRRFPASDRAAG